MWAASLQGQKQVIERWSFSAIADALAAAWWRAYRTRRRAQTHTGQAVDPGPDHRNPCRAWSFV
jgi:hypothetical protein